MSKFGVDLLLQKKEKATEYAGMGMPQHRLRRTSINP